MTQAMEDSRDGAHEHPFRIGPYTVLRRIGRGAMGVVYSAYDEKLDRKVALKHLRIAHEAGTLGQSRLLREAQALARVSHPNVVQVYEVGEHEREVYIAMEFVRGHTLREWIRGPVRPWHEILGVYLQAGRGLAAVHAAGLVHRDFKPDNVMLGDDGRVRVMDFGLARALDEPGATLQGESPLTSQDVSLSRTAAGRIIGTPAYMAPEQHVGGACEARTDQFAFCVALYEALYGQRPFAGTDLRTLTASVSQGRIREPSRRPVPRWLRRILTRGLAVDLSRRWPSMPALLAEIERGQTQARRRVAAGVAIAAGVVAAAAYGWHRNELARRVDRCELAGASITEVWNDPTRARVHAALIATGLPHAPTTADKLMPWLDRQSAAWSLARADACMDAETGPADPVLLDRSLWCLDERRLALESLVEELAHADATMVQRAVQAAAALESPAQCRDPAVLTQLPTPPSSGRAALRAVQAELLRAGNLQSAGRYDDGLTLARTALTQAEALAWPPLVARAHLRLGGLLAKQGKQLTEAEAAAEAAYFEAAAAGVTGVMADAATDLVHIVGERLARPVEGQRWARLAELPLRALEPEPGLRTAARLSNLAVVHRVAGAYDLALPLHEQALAIRESALDPDHPDVASSLNNLANTHFMMGAYPQALALHRRALAIREQALGPDHPHVADSLNNLANTHTRMDDLPEALALQRRALAIRERALGHDHLDVANSLNNLANIHHGLGALTDVKPLYERALVILERNLGPEHPTLAASLSNLAIVEEALGARERARALHERALAINEKAFGPEHPTVADSLNDLANLHGKAGDRAEERRLHERALAIREQALGPTHPDVAMSLQNLANLDLLAGAYPAAKVRATRALQIREAALGPEHPELAMSLECLAAIALATRDPAAAVPLATRALTLFEAEDPSADTVARTTFLLARAVWDAAIERPRARELATRARDLYQKTDGDHHGELTEVETWLAAHPEPPPATPHKRQR